MKDKRQFKRKPFNYKPLLWVVGAVLFIAILYFINMNIGINTLTSLSVIRNYVCLGFVAIGISIVVHALTGIFTKNRTFRIVTTIFVMIIMIMLYSNSRQSKVERIKEDKLYIYPNRN